MSDELNEYLAWLAWEQEKQAELLLRARAATLDLKPNAGPDTLELTDEDKAFLASLKVRI